MNARLFKANWSEFKGELKQEWDKFTDDDLTKIEGEYDMFMAVAHERYVDQSAEVSRWAYEWYSVVQLPVDPPSQSDGRLESSPT